MFGIHFGYTSYIISAEKIKTFKNHLTNCAETNFRMFYTYIFPQGEASYCVFMPTLDLVKLRPT